MNQKSLVSATFNYFLATLAHFMAKLPSGFAFDSTKRVSHSVKMCDLLAVMFNTK